MSESPPPNLVDEVCHLLFDTALKDIDAAEAEMEGLEQRYGSGLVGAAIQTALTGGQPDRAF